jgi:hypothetical protein
MRASKIRAVPQRGEIKRFASDFLCIVERQIAMDRLSQARPRKEGVKSRRNKALYRYHRYLLLLTSISFLYPVCLATSAEIVRLKSDQDVTGIVSSAPAGTTFVFSPGTYRMQSIVPKDNDVFRGEGVVILNGSKLLEMHPDNGLWSADEARAKWNLGKCEKGYPLCWMLNDLFIDDQVQTPVEAITELGPGRWFYDDSAGKIYISTNPLGHKVEFGETPAAFSGTANGVKINHLIVEKYASPPQRGAIGGDGAAGQTPSWTVMNSEVRWNHGTGIQLGSNAHVDSCHIHDNGQKGLGSRGSSVLIENNEIARNNFAGYDTSWEAGGTKFIKTENLTVRSNYIHDNLGNGLWTDTDNFHTLYERNKVTDNTIIGIQHEISYDAVIRNNFVKGNHLGILVANSSNVEVYGNVVEVPINGTEGIRISNGQRGAGKYGPYVGHDNHIHNNMVIYLGSKGYSGLTGDLTTATGNTFDSNDYHLVGGGDDHWIWSSPKTIAAMRQMGMEQHGTITKILPVVPDPTHTDRPK